MSRDLVGPPSDSVLVEEVGDEILLYDTSHKRFVSLNTTAADVWRMATGEFDVEEIVTRLASSYGVDPADIRDQVEKTIEQLNSVGLLRSQT